jgi:hypothetical protein
MDDAKATLLNAVKEAMLISGDAHDKALSRYIDEVKAYMVAAGVPTVTVESDVATGIITRGVIDLWNLGAGEAQLSSYFRERVIQLALGQEVPDGNV